MVASKIKRLLDREDFRQRPVRAISRRVIWRLRSYSSNRLWQLPLQNGLTVFAPHSGAGALIYYQGCTEPETGRFLDRFLRPGMTFIDIGAHIGEYTLQASLRVGPSGAVHAFEPQPDTFEILGKNVEFNRLANVTIQSLAMAESDGFVEFSVCAEPTLSSIRPTGSGDTGRGVKQTITVPKSQLDTYCTQTGCAPDLIKVDVEGAELNVLQGARNLLSKARETAPVWILEYTPHTYSRFGYSSTDVLDFLQQHGYILHGFDTRGNLLPLQPDEDRWGRSQNLVASKKPLFLS